jgi:hypothetical protein
MDFMDRKPSMPMDLSRRFLNNNEDQEVFDGVAKSFRDLMTLRI